MSPGTDDVHAHAQAVTAATLGIKLHAVYVTHGAPNPTIVSVMQDYATTSQGLYRQTQPNGTDAYLAVRDFLSGCRTASDVWMKDHASDVGQEPHGLTPVYYSPDIKLCNSASGCASSSNNPVFGSSGLNHVFVTLRNDGPNVVAPRTSQRQPLRLLHVRGRQRPVGGHGLDTHWRATRHLHDAGRAPRGGHPLETTCQRRATTVCWHGGFLPATR